jgi:hypothetical protein
MKNLSILFLLVSVTFNSVAQSKFDTCFQASLVAQAAFEAKSKNQKIKFVYTGDLIEGMLLNDAFKIGYKEAKTKGEAAEKAFKKCSNSGLI